MKMSEAQDKEYMRNKNASDHFFIEKMMDMQKLGKIKYVCWHISEDECIKVTRLEVTDIKDNTVSIAFPTIPWEMSGSTKVIVATLLSLIMDKVVFPFDCDDLVKQTNIARKKFPYTGKQWINEEEARLYDSALIETKI